MCAQRHIQYYTVEHLYTNWAEQRVRFQRFIYLLGGRERCPVLRVVLSSEVSSYSIWSSSTVLYTAASILWSLTICLFILVITHVIRLSCLERGGQRGRGAGVRRRLLTSSPHTRGSVLYLHLEPSSTETVKIVVDYVERVVQSVLRLVCECVLCELCGCV